MSAPPLSPSLQQLLWFVRVVEAGSFAEAARRAGATPSAVSKAISRFEQAHGVRLLHRTTHAIALTEEGDRLLDKGRGFLEDLERIETSLGELTSASTAGRVRITAPTSFARACIVPELPRLLRAHPDIRCEILFSNEILDLAAGGIDLAIRTGALDGLPGHVSRRLGTVPWVACAAPAYLEGRGAPRTPTDLAEHEHVGFRNKATGQILNWRFAGPLDKKIVRFTPSPRHVFDDADSAWRMAVAGFGIGWGPAWLGFDDLRDGRLIEVLADWRAEETPLWLVRLDNRYTPKRTQAVMDFIASLPVARPV